MNIAEAISIMGQDPMWHKDQGVYELLHSAVSGEYADMGIINTIVRALSRDSIILGSWEEGKNDDDRASSINTAVIHHTGALMDVKEINAIDLLRLYMPLFANDVFQGQIASGHYLHEQQTFVGYHHLVEPSGASKQLLRDEYTGFHAGNYGINCKSIGIGINGDLSHREPSSQVIESIARIIKSYPSIENIIGHNEIVDTTCPGNEWQNWKEKLKRLVFSS